MKKLITHHAENTQGRDFIVGDIHNSISKLLLKLEEVEFDHNRDRLFSVGDLFDRGEDIDETIEFFLEHTGESFFPVLGNHELMLLDYLDNCEHYDNVFLANGGWWILQLDENIIDKISQAVRKLPYIRTIQKDGKLYSVSHSEIEPNYEECSEERLKALTWSRRMWNNGALRTNNPTIIKTPENITSCFVGHTIHSEVKISGKYINLDTGSFLQEGDITLWEL